MRRTAGRQEIADNILAAIVRGDWEAIFEQPIPQIAVEPEELFGAWLVDQEPPHTPNALQGRWALFLRRCGKRWNHFYRSPTIEVSENLLFAVHYNLCKLWPGEGNRLPNKPLRVTRDLINEHSQAGHQD